MQAQRKEAFDLRAEALTNTTMPDDLFPNRSTFQRLGFKFSEKVSEDNVDVEIPEGWTRHSTGNYRVLLYDDKGRLRVEVRRQLAWLLPRYRITKDIGYPGKASWTVIDGSAVLYRGNCGTVDYECQDELFQEAKEWLLDHYPKADDPVAYW